MTQGQFEKMTLKRMKEIVDAYRKLGEDDYISLCWASGHIGIHNNKPTGGTPEIDVFVKYPEE